MSRALSLIPSPPAEGGALTRQACVITHGRPRHIGPHSRRAPARGGRANALRLARVFIADPARTSLASVGREACPHCLFRESSVARSEGPKSGHTSLLDCPGQLMLVGAFFAGGGHGLA